MQSPSTLLFCLLLFSLPAPCVGGLLSLSLLFSQARSFVLFLAQLLGPVQLGLAGLFLRARICVVLFSQLALALLFLCEDFPGAVIAPERQLPGRIAGRGGCFSASVGGPGAALGGIGSM